MDGKSARSKTQDTGTGGFCRWLKSERRDEEGAVLRPTQRCGKCLDNAAADRVGGAAMIGLNPNHKK